MSSSLSSGAGHAVPGEPFGDGAGQLGAVQVARRHVHGDRDRQPLGPPLRDLRERGVDHEVGEPVHQPGRLGQRDELVRRDEAAARVVPAHQRLDADHLRADVDPVPQRDLGLVVQLELVGVQRAAQRGQQAEPVGRVAVPGGVVHLDAGVLLLGQVHRDVGPAHQLLDVGAVVGVDGDPDARLQLEEHLLEVERLDQRVAHPARHVGDVVVRPDVGHHHGELVAAEPGHQVLRPQHALDPPRHQLEQPVADVVAEGVVDLLEPVQVQQRDREPLDVRTIDRLAEPLQQQLAVGQPGQRVVQGGVLLDDRHPGGLVDREHRDQEQRHVPRAAHRGEHDQRRQRQHRRGRHHVVREVLGERLAEGLPGVGADAGHQDVVDQEPDDPGRDDPEQVRAGQGTTGRHQPVRQTGDHHRDRGRGGRDHVLPDVEEELPRRLALDQLGRDGHARLQQQRGPQPPQVHDREHEGGGGDGALRVVPAGGAHGTELAEQDQGGDHPEGRGHLAHDRLHLHRGDDDQGPADPHGEVPGQGEQRPAGQRRPGGQSPHDTSLGPGSAHGRTDPHPLLDSRAAGLEPFE